MAPRSPSGSATARPTLALRRATRPRLSSPPREPLRSGSARPATRSSTCLLPCSVFRPCRYRCSRSTACRWGCRSPVLSVRTPRCSRWRPRSAICRAQRLRFPQFSSEASMRFGWLTLSLSPSPEEDADRIGQLIEQVRFAERLGFGDVWLTEHYFTGESVYNDALLFASAVAMRTERIRIGFAVVQLPFHHPARRPACAARQSEPGPDRCRSGQGHDLQRVRICRAWVAQRRQPRAHGGGDRYHRPPVGRWPRHLQWQVFPGAGPAIAAAPGATPPPAALARRDLAVVVQRMRPARRADPDGAPAGRTDQGALGGLRGGAEFRRA